MKLWLKHVWGACLGSFWFIPGVLVCIAIVLSLALPEVDAVLVFKERKDLGWLLTSPDAARLMLSSQAGALITVTGVVFSLTMVTLSITSSQYGPRLLRNVMDDRVTQTSLGLFLATSIYCLLLLRTINAQEDSIFVPHVSVFASLVATICSLLMVIYFMHHIATASQAHVLIGKVAEELDNATDRLYPQDMRAETAPHGEGDRSSEISGETIPATFEGYLQAVDTDGLLELATDRNLQLAIVVHPGQFITRGQNIVMARALAGETPQAPPGSLESEVNQTFLSGLRRTPEQDVGAVVDELVEVGVRALSPGINDPITATMCLDRLAAGLSRLVRRALPRTYMADVEGVTRLIISRRPVATLVQSAFEQLLIYGRDDPVVIRSAIAAIDKVRAAAVEESVKQILDQMRSMGEQSLVKCDNLSERSFLPAE